MAEDVLIAGAGPTGLTAGIELLRRGIEVRVVETRPERVGTSRALAVHSRTLEHLDQLGLADRFVDAGTRLHDIRLISVSDDAVEPLAHFSTDTIDSPFPFVLSLAQTETERLLEEHFVSLGGRLERGVRLETARDRGDHVTVVLAREEGAAEQTHPRWLIGCDGGHSTVRETLDIGFEVVRTGRRFVMGDVEAALGDGATLHGWFTEQGPVAWIPHSRPGFGRLIAMAPEDLDAKTPTLDQLQSVVDARLPDPPRLSAPGWLTTFETHHGVADTYRVGHVLLAGDASHVHSPVGGQGMNLGMQDAFNLAWKLALVIRGAAPEALLDSYEAERRPLAQETARGTTAGTRMVTLRGRVSQRVRDEVLGLFLSLGLVQRRAMQTLSMQTVAYRDSPLVAEDRMSVFDSRVVRDAQSEVPSVAGWLHFGEGPKPGEHAPDAPLVTDGDDQLRALLRAGRHVLLLFDGPAATEAGYDNLDEIATAVSDRYGDRVDSYVVVPGAGRGDHLSSRTGAVLDPDWLAHQRYHADGECLYLLRPDGYVAYRSQPADRDRLLDYLARVFLPQPSAASGR